MQVRSLYRCIGVIALLGAWACHRYEGVVYRVESGDNLQTLAQKFNVNPDALLKANPRMKYYPVRPGEKILVPQKIDRSYIPPTKSRYVSVTERYPDPGFPSESEPTEAAPVASAPKIEISAPTAPSSSPIRVPKGPKAPAVTLRSKSTKPKKNAHDLRFLWPAKGKVISTFGKKDQKMHNGIDIRTSAGGEVRASEVGTVVFCGNELTGYGNLVILRHRPKIYSVYAYLSKIAVKKGDTVSQGQVIAKVGNSQSNSFFHFEIRNGKQALDPLKHLP